MSTASHPVDSGSGSLRPAGSDPAGSDPQALRDAVIARFVGLALACVHQEYPNKIAHVLNGDADVRPPRELTPAFYGCYDWHSSVHGHWLLARVARLLPDAPFARRRARRARAAASRAENIAGEVALPARARAGSASSGPTASRGCCSSAPSCASGARPQARDVGGGARSRSSARRSRASATGCRSSRSRSGSASTRRRPSRLGLVLDWARVARRRGAAKRSSTTRSRDFYGRDDALPARLRAVGRGLPLALPRRGRPDAARAAAGRVRAWLLAFLPDRCRATAAATGSRRASSPTRPTRSSRTSTG